MIPKEEFDKEKNRMVSKKYLRPFIRGYTESLWNKQHNHSIAVDEFRKSFNKEGYSISPFLYPEKFGVREPVSFVMKETENGWKVISRIYWKRHPEIYDFIFKWNEE